jgi:hypothetical protein
MSYSDDNDAFIDDHDDEEECIQQDDHDYEPSPSGDDSASFISASSSSGKSSVSIEFDLDFHQNIENNLVPITTLQSPSTPPTGCCPDPPSVLTQQKHQNLPPSTQEVPSPVQQLPSPIVSNDTTANTCTTTASITPSPSKLKSKYPIYKSPIQPQINEVLPAFVKVNKRKGEKVSIEESEVAKHNSFSSGNSTDSSALFENRRRMKRAKKWLLQSTRQRVLTMTKNLWPRSLHLRIFSDCPRGTITTLLGYIVYLE